MRALSGICGAICLMVFIPMAIFFKTCLTCVLNVRVLSIVIPRYLISVDGCMTLFPILKARPHVG